MPIERPDPDLQPNMLRDSDLKLDEVHSFVVRVSINRAHGGRGQPRPQFQFEHVNRQTAIRSNSLQDLLARLERQIKAIFEELEFSEGC